MFSNFKSIWLFTGETTQFFLVCGINLALHYECVVSPVTIMNLCTIALYVPSLLNPNLE